MVKTDANGDSLWSRTFGGSNGENCRSVQQTADGGYILGGHTYSYGAGSSDFWLVRIARDCVLPLLAPEELVAKIDGDTLRLSWQQVPCATSYDVMWSEDPENGIGLCWYLREAVLPSDCSGLTSN